MHSIGIVGAGDIVRKVHLPVLQNLTGVRIAWLYDRDAARCRAVAEAYQVPWTAANVPDELPECDVVLLAVPVPVRESYLRCFARRGTAVLCEKPFALSAAEHSRYLDWFPAHRLGCGYMRRYYQSTRIIAHLLERNWLGPLRSIHIGEGGRSRGSGGGQSFLDDPAFAAAGGVLMDLGTHTLDLALLFARSEIFAVEQCELTLDGIVDRHVKARARLSQTRLELDYAVSWLDPQPNRIELRFGDVSVWSGVGPDARVFMGDDVLSPDAIELRLPVGGATTVNQAFALEWRDFLDGVAGGQESRVSARAALATTALAEQMRTSALAAHA